MNQSDLNVPVQFKQQGPAEFANLLIRLLEADSDAWQGRKVPPGHPKISPENLSQLLEQNQVFLANPNPVIGSCLQRLAERICLEFPDDAGCPLTLKCLQVAKSKLLPPEIILEVMRFDNRSIFEKMEFFRRTKILSSDWYRLTSEAKIEWINDSNAPIGKATDIRTLELALQFIEEAGPKLRRLHLMDFPDIADSHIDQIISACPSLVSITICNSRITNASVEKICRAYQHQLKTLGLINARAVEKIPENLPETLVEFSLSECVHLEGLPALPSHLQTLKISCCYRLANFRDPLPQHLRLLDLFSCAGIDRLPDKLPTELCELRISFCNSLQTLPDELPPHLKILDIYGCKLDQQTLEMIREYVKAHPHVQLKM